MATRQIQNSQTIATPVHNIPPPPPPPQMPGTTAVPQTLAPPLPPPPAITPTAVPQTPQVNEATSVPVPMMNEAAPVLSAPMNGGIPQMPGMPGGPPLPQLNMQNMRMPSALPSSVEDMDFSQFDLTGIQSGFRILPENIIYEWEILEVEVQTSKNNNRMMKLSLVTTFPDEYAGVKTWDYVTTSPESLWKLKSLAGACGFLSEDGTRVTASSVRDFKGQIVRAGIKHDTYQGQVNNKIAGGYEEAFETSGIIGASPPQIG